MQAGLRTIEVIKIIFISSLMNYVIEKYGCQNIQRDCIQRKLIFPPTLHLFDFLETAFDFNLRDPALITFSFHLAG